MIMQLQTGAVDYRLHRYAHRSWPPCAKDDNLVILNFSGTDGDFQFATEEERAENVNIGISVQKGNTQLTDAIDTRALRHERGAVQRPDGSGHRHPARGLS